MMVIVPGTWYRLGWICRGLFRLRIVEIGKMFIPTYLPVLLSLIIVGSHSLILNYLYFNYVFILYFRRILSQNHHQKFVIYIATFYLIERDDTKWVALTSV